MICRFAGHTVHSCGDNPKSPTYSRHRYDRWCLPGTQRHDRCGYFRAAIRGCRTCRRIEPMAVRGCGPVDHIGRAGVCGARQLLQGLRWAGTVFDHGIWPARRFWHKLDLLCQPHRIHIGQLTRDGVISWFGVGMVRYHDGPFRRGGCHSQRPDIDQRARRERQHSHTGDVYLLQGDSFADVDPARYAVCQCRSAIPRFLADDR